MAPPTKPRSSPTAVKMKSVCCSGTKPFLVCTPSPKPAPSKPPDAIAALEAPRLNWVGVGAAAATFAVDWLVKPREPLELVALDLAGHHRRADERRREQQQHDDVHGLEPGDDEHGGRAHHDHEHRAEVVLGVDDRHHETGQADRDRRPATRRDRRGVDGSSRRPRRRARPWRSPTAGTGTDRPGTTPGRRCGCDRARPRRRATAGSRDRRSGHASRMRR